jgi:hypothetical protein
MKIFKCFLALSLALLCPSTHAKVIALGSPSKQEEFKTFLVQTPGYISLTDHILSKTLSSNDLYLDKKYNIAIKGLALADLKPSIFIFKEIVELKNNLYIFSDNKIDLISESYFRLANLDRTNEGYWIKQGLIDYPDFKPSEDTFNPQIIRNFYKEQKKTKDFLFNLEASTIKPEWSSAFLNSKRVNDSILIYPSGTYNLQVFKNGFMPYKKTFEGAELIKAKSVKLMKYNLGSCQKPRFFVSELNKTVDAIYFSKDCIAEKNDYPSVAFESTNSTYSENLDLNKSGISSENKTTKKTILSNKKSWYYIAGGIILTSLAIGFSQSSDTKVRPVRHD